MNHDEYLKSVQEKMIKLIDDIEANNIYPIEGIRELLRLRNELDLSNDPAFVILIGIDSETMDFPLGLQRANYNAETLARLDKDLNQIVKEEQKNISAALEKIRSRLEAI
jgi:hypothetical protein